MARQRRSRTPLGRLVFAFQLQPGDVVLEAGARLKIVGRPTSMSAAG
jgi:hypothetical protein